MLSLALISLALLSPAVTSADETTGPLPDPSHIVAIGGSITEIFYALGEEGRLIARDSTSVYPEAALKLPDIGYMRALSPEGVLSVNPSAIVALEGSGPREAVDVLKKAKVPYLTVPETFDREGILAKIRLIGRAIGQEQKAAELAASVDKDLGAAEARAAGIVKRQRVLFILSAQDGKIFASGTDTAADAIIKLAGGENAIKEFRGYRQLSEEAIVTADPDVILMMSRGGPSGPSDADLLAHPAIASTPAGKDGRLIRMDGAYLLGFGPRTAAAARELAVKLYGSAAAN
ncbi:ABC transporter substrate-binding protein [Mesorhizobium sp. BAC0120]|uniref:heme/hemin ABC transporter substrate-binding protein n=1 Tax=Mesorhizobium sp. BAC0120 TaxID=3090670 RepID=UPI00298C5B71|nr:ABC transporter substrate-binding protein [Mesorhizobium sp. BAC0120]MDW6025835.1 ABC transporter substrate-binding protein [Mesorhizobium sp. BAC0120]